MTELEQLKKENAELKRQLEVQRFMIDNNLGMLKIIVDETWRKLIGVQNQSQGDDTPLPCVVTLSMSEAAALSSVRANKACHYSCVRES